MDDNVNYVVAGYLVTIATLSAYGGWLWFRLRRARRAGELDRG